MNTIKDCIVPTHIYLIDGNGDWIAQPGGAAHRRSTEFLCLCQHAVLAFSMIVMLAMIAAPMPARAADPDALWHKVVEACLKSDPQQDRQNPCDVVRPDADFLLVKDICGPTQYLLLPAHRLSGIESDELATAPNYFRFAWEQRDWVGQRAGRKLAPQDLALAINSIDRRSQNQLHIHIDLVRPGLSDALRPYQYDPVGAWSLFRYQGHDYHLTRLTDLATQNPITLVRARVAAAQGVMRHQTIGLIGATFADGSTGFYLLNGEFDGSDDGSGWAEELEIDHPRNDCSYHRVPGP
jgi:CDP-diacylglycerol pyrophosphatase